MSSGARETTQDRKQRGRRGRRADFLRGTGRPCETTSTVSVGLGHARHSGVDRGLPPGRGSAPQLATSVRLGAICPEICEGFEQITHCSLGLTLATVGKSTEPPVALWAVALAMGVIGVGLVIFGGSLVGFGISTTSTVVAVGCLFVNRQRQMSPGYNYGKPWFHKAVSAVYWLGAVGSLVHMVRYAIAVAAN